MIPRGMKIDIDSLVPEKRDHVKYSGSLTTPPCTEGILWHVMTQSVPITQKQVRATAATPSGLCAAAAMQHTL